MRLIRNSGSDRVLDVLKALLTPGCAADVASPELSLFAFAELSDALNGDVKCRLVVPDPAMNDLAVLGSEADRNSRNKLQARWLAKRCTQWIWTRSQVQRAPAAILNQPPWSINRWPDKVRR